jgi:hydroxyacylglutathione hydrolase
VTETVAATKQLEVVVYEATGLGDRSYLVHDGDNAFVVDPQRDPKPFLETAAILGVEITLVLETHVHNDYVSGGLALARKTGATYGVPAGVHFDFSTATRALEEGDVLRVGELQVRVLLTPGHTPHHLSFVAKDPSGRTVALTGGSLLAGATGRTDLFGPARAVSLAEAQWRSVRRLLRELPPNTKVLPTHGFGSFCAGAAGGAGTSGSPTIRSERLRNPAARLDLDPFVKDLLSNPLPIPAYYQHMAPLNWKGAAEPRYGPVPVIAPSVLAARMSAGTAVVDLRPRRVFAAAHLRGALNMELGVNLATYFGWLVPFAAPSWSCRTASTTWWRPGTCCRASVVRCRWAGRMTTLSGHCRATRRVSTR